MVFPTFLQSKPEFSSKELMIWAPVSSRSFSVFSCKEHNRSDFSIDHLVMFICRVISCVVGKWCLLWPACFLDKTISLWPASFCTPRPKCLGLLSWVSLDFLVIHSNPLWWKGHLLLVLVLEGVVCLHGTGQLQLLQYQGLGHSLGLLWCWMACLGNESRSFCCFWDCTQVLYFGFSCKLVR